MASRGNNSAYLKNRLKRQHPEIFKNLGKFHSIRAAAIAAGIVKQQRASWLESAKAGWKKATKAEKEGLLWWIYMNDRGAGLYWVIQLTAYKLEDLPPEDQLALVTADETRAKLLAQERLKRELADKSRRRS